MTLQFKNSIPPLCCLNLRPSPRVPTVPPSVSQTHIKLSKPELDPLPQWRRMKMNLGVIYFYSWLDSMAIQRGDRFPVRLAEIGRHRRRRKTPTFVVGVGCGLTKKPDHFWRTSISIRRWPAAAAPTIEIFKVENSLANIVVCDGGYFIFNSFNLCLKLFVLFCCTTLKIWRGFGPRVINL